MRLANVYPKIVCQLPKRLRYDVRQMIKNSKNKKEAVERISEYLKEEIKLINMIKILIEHDSKKPLRRRKSKTQGIIDVANKMKEQ